jgi:Flp pilus assembly protein CpaB
MREKKIAGTAGILEVTMNKRFVLAIFVGLLAIFVAMRMGPKPEKPPEATPEPVVVIEKVKVLVATVDLKKDTKLNETAVELNELEKVKDKVPASALKDASEVSGKAAAVYIERGSVVTKEMLKKVAVIDKLSMEIDKGRVR